MSILPVVNPARVGFLPDRLEKAADRLRAAVEKGEMPGAALCVGRRGAMAEPRLFGVPDDALFLVASLTKPVVAAAVMLLVERGRLGLDDRAVEYLPELSGEGKADLRVRHLLTHTSGLPDQLPENRQIRSVHSPLTAFIAGACRHPLLFPPGTRVRYQSMGFALLAAILERIEGTSLPEFLRRELFEPLGMADTALGVGPERRGRVVRLILEPEQEGTDWSWNSPYWLALGAPWGGLVTSPADFARFCRMMLDEGILGRSRVLAPATVRAMTRNQLAGMPAVPEEDRRCRPWGLGWRLAWPAHSANFGDLLGPNVYGHWGATGTLCWNDPDADAFCLVFTTLPSGDEGRHLARVSNLVAASLA